MQQIPQKDHYPIPHIGQLKGKVFISSFAWSILQDSSQVFKWTSFESSKREQELTAPIVRPTAIA